MVSEYMTMAQAVGEAPIGSPVFFPGEDYDPDGDEEFAPEPWQVTDGIDVPFYGS